VESHFRMGLLDSLMPVFCFSQPHRPMKPQYRAGKNGVHATIGHPAPADAVNARVVNFNMTFAILVDRKLLPLAAQIQMLQNVVNIL
jgi:hypothetical protein